MGAFNIEFHLDAYVTMRGVHGGGGGRVGSKQPVPVGWENDCPMGGWAKVARYRHGFTRKRGVQKNMVKLSEEYHEIYKKKTCRKTKTGHNEGSSSDH